jgi:hypothetical protein
MTDGYDKIRVKGSVHAFKRGPAPTGAARLERRVNRLLLDAARLARRENAYAARLRELLHAFLADDHAHDERLALEIQPVVSQLQQRRGTTDESHD